MEKATSTSSMERKGKHIKWKCILHTEYLNLLALSFSFVFFITLASFDAAMCHVRIGVQISGVFSLRKRLRSKYRAKGC